MKNFKHLKNIYGENSYFWQIIANFGDFRQNFGIFMKIVNKLKILSSKKIYILTISFEKSQILSLIIFNI